MKRGNKRYEKKPKKRRREIVNVDKRNSGSRSGIGQQQKGYRIAAKDRLYVLMERENQIAANEGMDNE